MCNRTFCTKLSVQKLAKQLLNMILPLLGLILCTRFCGASLKLANVTVFSKLPQDAQINQIITDKSRPIDCRLKHVYSKRLNIDYMKGVPSSGHGTCKEKQSSFCMKDQADTIISTSNRWYRFGESLSFLVIERNGSKQISEGKFSMDVQCPITNIQSYFKALEFNVSCLRTRTLKALNRSTLFAAFSLSDLIIKRDIYFLEISTKKLNPKIDKSTPILLNPTVDKSRYILVRITSSQATHNQSFIKPAISTSHNVILPEPFDDIIKIPLHQSLLINLNELSVYIDAYHQQKNYIEGLEEIYYTHQHLQMETDAVKLKVVTASRNCEIINCLKRYAEPWNRNTTNFCPDVDDWLQWCSEKPTVNIKVLHFKYNQSTVISCECTYSKKAEEVELQLIKDGIPVGSPAKIWTKNDASGMNYTHTISPTKFDHQGEYVCQVKTMGYSIKSTKRLLLIEDAFHVKFIFRNDSQQGFNRSKTSRTAWIRTLTQAVNSSFEAHDVTSARQFTTVLQNRQTITIGVTSLNITSNAQQHICSKLHLMKKELRSKISVEIIHDIQMISHGCCVSTLNRYPYDKSNSYWPAAMVNVTSRTPCSHQHLADKAVKFATRRCIWNATHEAQWTEPNKQHCTGDHSYTLKQLSSINVTKHNVAQVSKQLVNATYWMKNIATEIDIDMIANIIDMMSTLGEQINCKTLDNILAVTSNVMDVKARVVAKSQKKFLSSKRMLISLQKIANEIKLPTHKLSLQKKNIALCITLVSHTASNIILGSGSSQQTEQCEINAPTAGSLESDWQSKATVFLPGSIFALPDGDKQLMMDSANSLLRLTSFRYRNDKLFLPGSPKQRPHKHFSSHTSGGHRENGHSHSHKRHRSVHNSRFRHNSTHNSSRHHWHKIGIISNVISASIKDKQLTNLTEKEEIRLEMETNMTLERDQQYCVFWDFKAQGGFGAWSRKGCKLEKISGNRVTCRCNHMTNFAVLMDIDQEGIRFMSKEEKSVLTVFTYIGCGISLICLLITFVTYAAFKNLRKKQPPQILMHLCMSLMLTLMVFIAGMQSKDKTTCQAFGLLNHFFVLATFCWMAIEGVNLYLCLVKIVRSKVSHLLLKSNLFAWGVPSMIVIITVSIIKLDGYGKKVNGDWACFVTGKAFYASFLAPVVIILVMNLISLALVSRSISKQPAISRCTRMTNMTKVRIAVACSVLMGTTWLIGFFAIGTVKFLFQLLFCILNPLQGCFIFVFHCARSEDVRKEWMRCLTREDTPYPAAAAVILKLSSRKKQTISKEHQSNAIDSMLENHAMKTHLTALSETVEILEQKTAVNQEEAKRCEREVLFNGKLGIVILPGDEEPILLTYRSVPSVADDDAIIADNNN